MKRKKIIWLTVLIVALGGAWYGYKEYTRTNKDLLEVKAGFILSAVDLIKEYESNDSAATKKYNGKIVEVNGSVKKVETDEQGYYTIVLGDTANLSSIRCSMDSTHYKEAANIVEGSSVTIRGACTGFNKDEMGLGSDVILNRSVIIKKEN
jgi:uncharacterized protein (DUF1330 family)